MKIHLYVGRPGSGKTTQMLHDSKNTDSKKMGYIDGSNPDYANMITYRKIREKFPDIRIFTRQTIRDNITYSNNKIAEYELKEKNIKYLIIDEGNYAFNFPEVYEIIKTMEEVRIALIHIPLKLLEVCASHPNEIELIVHEMPNFQMKAINWLRKFGINLFERYYGRI